MRIGTAVAACALVLSPVFTSMDVTGSHPPCDANGSAPQDPIVGFSSASSLDEHRRVAGDCLTASSRLVPCVWARGCFTDLGYWARNFPTGAVINKHGQVAGTSFGYDLNGYPVWMALVWDKGQLTDLGHLAGPEFRNQTHAINDRGQVIGVSGTSSFEDAAFFWDGVMHDLGVRHAEPVALNNRGQVLVRQNADNGTKEFLWDGGSLTELDLLRAHAINDHGQVVGWATSIRAAIWEAGATTELGVLDPTDDYSVALKINRSAQVIGQSCRNTPERPLDDCKAFLWDEGTMVDLVGLGGDHTDPRSINGRGQILAVSLTWGTDQTYRVRTFVWDHGTVTEIQPGSSGDVYGVDLDERGRVLGVGPQGWFLWDNGQRIDLGTTDPAVVTSFRKEQLDRLIGQASHVRRSRRVGEALRPLAKSERRPAMP